MEGESEHVGQVQSRGEAHQLELQGRTLSWDLEKLVTRQVKILLLTTLFRICVLSLLDLPFIVDPRQQELVTNKFIMRGRCKSTIEIACKDIRITLEGPKASGT